MIIKKSFSQLSELDAFLKNFTSGQSLILLFCGSPAANGLSWCSDCVKAEPVIEGVLKEYEAKDLNFVTVTVGSREEWKDPKSPYRTDPRFKLTSVPTLLLYGTAERLGADECQSADLIRLLFEGI